VFNHFAIIVVSYNGRGQGTGAPYKGKKDMCGRELALDSSATWKVNKIGNEHEITEMTMCVLLLQKSQLPAISHA
jgi:hypothetical protein